MTTETAHWIPTPEPGVYRGIDAKVYHRWDALGSTWVGEMATTSPKHFHRKRQKPRVSTPAQQFGSAFHCLLLEDFDFYAHYGIGPDCDKKSKANKERWARFRVENLGKEEVTRAQYDDARAMAHAVRADDEAGPLLANSEHEVSIVWDDPDFGIRLKARLDMWLAPAIYDAKSTINPGPRPVMLATYNYGYHRQAAMYTDGAQIVFGHPVDFKFIVAEKADPWDVVVKDVDDSVLVTGRDGVSGYKEAVKKVKECRESGVWPGYANDPVYFPEWLMKKEGLSERVML